MKRKSSCASTWTLKCIRSARLMGGVVGALLLAATNQPSRSMAATCNNVSLPLNDCLTRDDQPSRFGFADHSRRKNWRMVSVSWIVRTTFSSKARARFAVSRSSRSRAAWRSVAMRRNVPIQSRAMATVPKYIRGWRRASRQTVDQVRGFGILFSGACVLPPENARKIFISRQKYFIPIPFIPAQSCAI